MYLVGTDNAYREALLAGNEQRFVHLVKGLVERLDLIDPLVAGQVAPSAARVQEPLPLIQVILIPGMRTAQLRRYVRPALSSLPTSPPRDIRALKMDRNLVNAQVSCK